MPDPLGSTAALLDSSQNQTDTWEYWPYGEVASRTGPNATPFAFCGIWGYFKDLVDRLSYVQRRFLLPSVGKWLTTDPGWPQRPAYRYASSPNMHVDPSGLDEDPCQTAFDACVKRADDAKSRCEGAANLGRVIGGTVVGIIGVVVGGIISAGSGGMGTGIGVGVGGVICSAGVSLWPDDCQDLYEVLYRMCETARYCCHNPNVLPCRPPTCWEQATWECSFKQFVDPGCFDAAYKKCLKDKKGDKEQRCRMLARNRCALVGLVDPNCEAREFNKCMSGK